jgi:hypothetical protein
VLDAPQGLEAEGLGHIAETQFVAINIPIGAPLARTLKNHRYSDVHDHGLLYF